MFSSKFSIIPVNANETEKLQKIGQQTFIETFAEYNTDENMNSYVLHNFSFEKLSSELHNINSEFYFATHENEIIGYLKINFGDSQTELKDNKALEIERIYVVKAFQGKQVGQLLFDKAITIAKNKSAIYAWLGVWEENHKAIQFYTKNGFETFDKHIFKLGDEEQTDLMMRLKLN